MNQIEAFMTIDIGPELEAKLAAHAHAIGMPVQRFVEHVLEREAQSAAANAPHPLAGRDKAKAFRNWASSFPADSPVLTLQDVSRENLYRREVPEGRPSKLDRLTQRQITNPDMTADEQHEVERKMKADMMAAMEKDWAEL